jgi:hypothetical protein
MPRQGTGGRDLDPHPRALAHYARDADDPPQRVHDVLGDGEAEPGSRALGREIGLEQVGQIGLGDPGTKTGETTFVGTKKEGLKPSFSFISITCQTLVKQADESS